MKEKIAVIAYNDVQQRLNEILVGKGFECEKVSLISSPCLKEYFGSFNRIILPFPSKKEKLFTLADTADVTDFFTKNQLIIGGMIDEGIKEKLRESEIVCKDYFEDEAYVVKNAFITVQGVLRLLLENTRGFLPGKTALVSGYGRIGSFLAQKLRNLGLKVYVAVRSQSAAALAEAHGFDVIKISQIKSTVFYFGFIFNTVPCEIFSMNDIKHMNSESVYFEIASKPYGARKEYFEKEEKKYVSASALPGRFYPEAVAQNIYEYIINRCL